MRVKRIPLLVTGLAFLFLTTACSAANDSNGDSAPGTAVPAATGVWDQGSKNSIVEECKIGRASCRERVSTPV